MYFLHSKTNESLISYYLRTLKYFSNPVTLVSTLDVACPIDNQFKVDFYNIDDNIP